MPSVTVPTIPASVAALIMLAGMGLVYVALSGLGLIKPADSIAGTGAATISDARLGTGNASGSNLFKGGGVAAARAAQDAARTGGPD